MVDPCLTVFESFLLMLDLEVLWPFSMLPDVVSSSSFTFLSFKLVYCFNEAMFFWMKLLWLCYWAMLTMLVLLLTVLPFGDPYAEPTAVIGILTFSTKSLMWSLFGSFETKKLDFELLRFVVSIAIISITGFKMSSSWWTFKLSYSGISLFWTLTVTNTSFWSFFPAGSWQHVFLTRFFYSFLWILLKLFIEAALIDGA